MVKVFRFVLMVFNFRSDLYSGVWVPKNCAPLPKDNVWYSLNLKYDATEQDVRALNIDKLTVLGICLLPEPWREI